MICCSWLYQNWKFEPLRGSPSRPLRGGHARFASWGPSAPIGGLWPHGTALRAHRHLQLLSCPDFPNSWQKIHPQPVISHHKFGKPWICLILSRFSKLMTEAGPTPSPLYVCLIKNINAHIKNVFISNYEFIWTFIRDLGNLVGYSGIWTDWKSTIHLGALFLHMLLLTLV